MLDRRKVSVVVPNYQHAQFLERRLQSIFEQSYSDIEVIILDDASSDNSISIIENFLHDPRVSLHVNTHNSGSPFIQWNKGAALATGEYLWFAESDDHAHPQFLEKMVPLLEADTRVGIAYCRSTMIDDEGRVLGFAHPSSIFDSTRWDSNFHNDGRDECRRFLYLCNTIPNASGVLVRREVYEEIGGANEEMTMYGDWDVWVRILLKRDICYLCEPLNFFRVPHERSQRIMTIAKDPRIGEWVRVAKRVEENIAVPSEVRKQAENYLAQKLLEFAVRGALRREGRAKLLESIREAREFDPSIIRRVLLLPFTRLARGRPSQFSK